MEALQVAGRVYLNFYAVYRNYFCFSDVYPTFVCEENFGKLKW